MFKAGDFVELDHVKFKIGLLVKPYIQDDCLGWICFYNWKHFCFTPIIKIMGKAEINSEEKRPFFEFINNMNYNGKYSKELAYVKTNDYKISTKYESDCTKIQHFLKKHPVQVGDFLSKKDALNAYCFLVVKILPDALILYVEGTDIFQVVHDPQYIIGFAELNDERKQKIYNDINGVVYGGINIEVVRNIVNKNFSVITKTDYIEDVFSILKIGNIYKQCHNYGKSYIKKIIFNTDNSVDGYSEYNNKTLLKGTWEKVEGQIFLNFMGGEFILRAYPNNQIRLYDFSSSYRYANHYRGFKEMYSQYWSHLIDNDDECRYY